jgi:hypothetical protein
MREGKAAAMLTLEIVPNRLPKVLFVSCSSSFGDASAGEQHNG